jgi:long-chain acyl-CoA synthetase
MREFSVPALVDSTETGGLADLVWTNAAEAPHAVVFSRKVDGRWQDVTARQFRSEVLAVARGLVASGVGPGDRVGLFSRTRYEWTLLDFAIWAAGGVVVPIYATSSAEQVQWILSDSAAVACVVEGPEHEDLVAQVRDALPDLRHVWRFDGGGVEAIVAAGADVDDETVEARRAGVRAEDVATIIYTSGTTGRPKGCVLTHRNFFVDADNSVELLHPLFKGERDEPSTLLFLPLAHVFGRAVEIGCVKDRVRLGHTADVNDLLEDLAAFRPTFILSVPHVFERVYNRARQKARSEGRGRIFEAAAATATAYSRALERGRPPLGLRARHALFDRLVYSKLRAALGGRVRYAVSGGAPLGERLTHFFRGIGLTVLEGYGLTETTAGSTINSPGQVRIGTVGRPFPGTTIRIADDGEILIRGGQVFSGYWNNEAATAEAFVDGWFATGDVGELDDDGYLRITGRKKELLVTAGGKNVAPAVIEDRIRAHPLVSQCIVVGDNRPFVGALVTVDQEMFPHWKAEHGKPAEATVADLLDDPDLLATLQEAVDAGNDAVSRAESVRRFRVLPGDFTVENGYLTPSLKLRRGVITKDFGAEIEKIYLRGT